jgi:serine/threonine-protein kinase
MSGLGGAGDVTDAVVQPGDVLAGKYRVERVLGAGGMGVVVSAHHLQLDERVAIKFLNVEASANPEAVARFEREARAAVKIKSEHVVRVTDVGALDNGAPYMVMEHLEGVDLATLLRQRGPLPVLDAIDFGLQACEALADAHALGTVHRDLKPSNLFLVKRSDGSACVKLLDFGISKVKGIGAAGQDLAMTKTATVMGSPLYMSPEQMESAKDVDSRTDIWAMGIVLYELLGGRPPFEGATVPEVCVKIATHAPPSFQTIRPDVPRSLEAVIFRCLEKNRANRYANVADLAVELAEFGPGHAKASAERVSRIIHAAGLSSRQSGAPATMGHGAGGSGTEILVGATLGSWGRTASGSRSNKKALVALAALATAGAIGTAFFVLRRSPPATDSHPVAAAPAPSPPAIPEVDPRPPAAPPSPAVAPADTMPAPADEANPAIAPVPAEAPRPATARPRNPVAAPVRPAVSGSRSPLAPRAAPASQGNVYDDRK